MNYPKLHNSAVLKFVWPYVSTAIVLVCGLLVFYLAGRLFGVVGFSEYSLSRRTISFVQPLLFQGFGLALTRQVAMTDATSDSRSSYTYLLATAMVFAAFMFLLGLASLFYASTLAIIFFGSDAYEYCMCPLAFVLVGIALHGIAWAFWRGKMCIGLACLMESLNLGLLPLSAFALGGSPAEVFWWTGCLTTICSTVALLYIVWNERCPLIQLGVHARELFRYAVPRIPGAFALAALLGLPATISAHVVDVQYAGYVAFGCSLLGMAGALVSPLGVVLLPHSTKMISAGRIKEVKQLVLKLLSIGFGISLAVVLCVEIFAEQTVTYFLGVNDADLVGIIRLLICSAVPFLIYLSLRSILDGVSHKALNSRNCILALLSLLLFSGVTFSLGGGVQLILVGSVGSMCVLAILTLLETYRVLEKFEIK